MTEQHPNLPDWNAVNWSKTNLQISEDLDCPVAVVSFYRKALGRKRSRLENFDWESLDWTKNNQQLAFENYISVHKVARARLILKKPKCLPGGGWNMIISEEMIASVDWETTRDSDLSRKWRVSRERVRQIRAERHLPRCVLNRVSQPGMEIEKWLIQNRDSIEGKVAREVAVMCPVNAATPVKYSAMKKSGISFFWPPKRHTTALTLPINWELPNSIIEAVWNRCKNWAATNRYRCRKVEPKWFIRGPRTFAEQISNYPDLISSTLTEIAKVESMGITPDYETLSSLGIPIKQNHDRPNTVSAIAS